MKFCKLLSKIHKEQDINLYVFAYFAKYINCCILAQYNLLAALDNFQCCNIDLKLINLHVS